MKNSRSNHKQKKQTSKTTQERRAAQNTHKEFSSQNIGFLRKDKAINTIYIGNLRYTKKSADIKEMFKTYGDVSYVRLVMNKKTRQSQGIAFVQMPCSKATKKAISDLNGKEVDGRTLKVSIAKDNR